MIISKNLNQNQRNSEPLRQTQPKSLLIISSDLPVNTLNSLLVQNPELVNTKDNKKETLLSYALKRKKVDIVNLILKIPILDLTYQDKDGNSYLHLAVISQLIEIVNELIKLKINLNIQNNNGDTALHLAYISNNTNIIDILIQNKCDMTIKNNKNKMAVELKFNHIRKKIRILSKEKEKNNVNSYIESEKIFCKTINVQNKEFKGLEAVNKTQTKKEILSDMRKSKNINKSTLNRNSAKLSNNRNKINDKKIAKNTFNKYSHKSNNKKNIFLSEKRDFRKIKITESNAINGEALENFKKITNPQLIKPSRNINKYKKINIKHNSGGNLKLKNKDNKKEREKAIEKRETNNCFKPANTLLESDNSNNKNYYTICNITNDENQPSFSNNYVQNFNFYNNFKESNKNHKYTLTDINKDNLNNKKNKKNLLENNLEYMNNLNGNNLEVGCKFYSPMKQLNFINPVENRVHPLILQSIGNFSPPFLNFNDFNFAINNKKFKNVPLIEFLTQINLLKYYQNLNNNGFDDIDFLIEGAKNGNSYDKELKDSGVELPGDRARIQIKLEEKANKYKTALPKCVYYMCKNLENIDNDENIQRLKNWLKTIKMEDYLQNFIKNGYHGIELLMFQMVSNNPINNEILKNEIGIEKVGFRSKILNRLRSESKILNEKINTTGLTFNEGEEKKMCCCLSF